MEKRPRDMRMDNIKALLIILVVLGHALELFLKSGSVKTIYKLIYSFHMPLFIFISGYFAKFNIKKILIGLAVPYVVFQSIYIFYVDYILDIKKNVSFSYSQPYWIMWYMMAMIVWSLSVPIISLGNRWIHALMVAAAFALSIAVGYVHTIGMKYTLSRIFVYFPFFMLGHYFADIMKNKEKRDELLSIYNKYKAPICLSSAAAFGAAVGLMVEYTKKYSYVWLYECAPYKVSHETPVIRAAHAVVALICIVYIYILTPNIKLNLFSKLGAKTKGVYLGHGFIILALKNMMGLI